MGETNDRPQTEGMLTVAHLAASYEGHLGVQLRLGQISPATLAWYKTALAKLTAAVGGFPAAELRAHHLTGCDFSNHFVRVLKALYKWAADVDTALVPRDPFAKLAVPKCGQRTRILSEDEAERLLGVSPPAFRLVLRCALLTGARPGELRAWLWGMVQLEHRLVILTKFKAKKKRADGKAVRPIPLSSEVVEILAGVRPTDAQPDHHVFLNSRRQPWSPNALRCAMRTARTAAGLDAGAGEGERVVLYTARHTFATNATRNGVQGRTLADIMGHTTTAMTQRYQHLTSQDLVDVIDRATARRG